MNGRTTREQHRAILVETQELLALRPKNEVLSVLVQRHGVSIPTAYRYRRIAERDMRRSLGGTKRSDRVAKLIARCDQAAKWASEKTRVVGSKESGFEVVPDPSPRDLLAAVSEEAKLLGLYAPEKHEYLVAHFTTAMQLVVQVINDEEPDAAIRGRMLQRLRSVFEDGPKGRIPDSLPAGEVVDAPAGDSNGAAHRD